MCVSVVSVVLHNTLFLRFDASFPATLVRTGKSQLPLLADMDRTALHTLLTAWMLALKLCQVINVIIDYDPEVIALIV